MCTGLFGQCREVGRGDACAHQNLDAPGGAVHKLPEQGCPGGGAGGLAAGQDGGKPQSAGRVQRREGVAADVKGAVEGERNGAARFGGGFAGGLVDGAQGPCIQRTVRGQHTGDDAVCPGGDECGGRLFHLGQLPAVVAEITEAGAEQGADGVELDVRLTRDGEVVVFHDASLERITGAQGCVEGKTLGQLKELDASGVHGGFRDVRIPTLREVYGLLRPSGLRINVEIKDAGEAGGVNPALLERLLALEAEFVMGGRVFYSSFSVPVLQGLSGLVEPERLALLYAHGPYQGWKRIRQVEVGWLHPRWYTRFTGFHVIAARRMGFGVNVWTVDDPDQIKAVIASGADGIITNCPDVAAEIRKQLVQRRGKHAAFSGSGDTPHKEDFTLYRGGAGRHAAVRAVGP